MAQNMIKMPFAEVFKNTQNEQIQLWKTLLIFDGNFNKAQEAQFRAWKTGSSSKVGIKTGNCELTELDTTG